MNEYQESLAKYKDMLEHIFMMTAEISVVDMKITILSFAENSSVVGKSFDVTDCTECFDVFSEDERKNFNDVICPDSLKTAFEEGSPKKICISAHSKGNIYSKFVISLYPDRAAGKLYMTVIDYDRSEHMITLMFKKNAVNIKVADIYYVDYGNHSVEIHRAHDKGSFFSVTFSDVAEMLLKYPNFLRSYKNCIVNMDHVSCIDDDSFVMDNGDRISIPKRRSKEIKCHYEDYKLLK